MINRADEDRRVFRTALSERSGGSFRAPPLASDEQERRVFVAPPRRDRGSTAATMDPNEYASRNRSCVFVPSISVPHAFCTSIRSARFLCFDG